MLMDNLNTVNVTARETYSLFDLFGDIGGLYEFFLITGNLVIQYFSHMKLNSLLANRLYYWPKSEEFNADEFSKPKEEQKKLRLYSKIPLLKYLGC